MANLLNRMNLPKGSAPFSVMGAKAVGPHAQVGEVNMGYAPYAPTQYCWNFPAVVPPGMQAWVTDLSFQSKNVKNPTIPGSIRSSYAVFLSMFTLPEHMPHVSFQSPIILPTNFEMSCWCINQSNEEQNMIVRLAGFMVPNGWENKDNDVDPNEVARMLKAFLQTQPPVTQS